MLAKFLRSYFLLPTLFSCLTLGLVWVFMGFEAFLLAGILSILEVTLSFDNAVVNAKVLARMTPLWQKRFLTWGILLAVFGTRLVLPIFIVALCAWQSPWMVAKLTFTNPEEYGKLLDQAHYAIGSFGGMFLFMVSIKYFIDEAKDVHWIKMIERHLSKWGRLEAIEVAMALTLLLGISWIKPAAQVPILVAGIIGIVLFIVMQGIANAYDVEASAASGGLALFIYLNILDSAFSLDGVVGAFAITNQLIIIVVGLGIGAYFVRSMTVYMVKRKMLDSIVYLEHGAHWAILGLAICMLVGLFFKVPEVITGLVGLAFVLAAWWTSKLYTRKHEAAKVTSESV